MDGQQMALVREGSGEDGLGSRSSSSSSSDSGGGMVLKTADEVELYDDQVLGEGAFGVVKLAKDKSTNVLMAVKQVDKAFVRRERKVEAIKREKDILTRLRAQPHIVHLYYTYQDANSLYFAMEYCPNGDLQTAIKAHGGLHIECARHYAAETLLALVQLRRQNIVHRDIKPDNLLLSAEYHAKLADFGTAKELTSHRDRSSSFVGTAEYVPPELLRQQGSSVGLAGDLYSYGVSVYQMICGRTPFTAPSQWLTFERIRSGKLSFPIGFPEDAEDLVRQLLVATENSRLGADDIELTAVKEHPFFLGIDWDAISSSTPPTLRAPDSPFIFEIEHTDDLSDAALERVTQDEERRRVIAKQARTPWGQFLIPKSEMIVKQGLLIKRAGIWNNGRKRMFLVTDLPRIIYVDPEKTVLKGEIPWDASLAVEIKDASSFNIVTPNRTYVLVDPSNTAHEWKAVIEARHRLMFGENSVLT